MSSTSTQVKRNKSIPFLSTLWKDRIADNLALWSLKYRKLRGKPFSFKGHLYLLDIYQDTHPDIVVKKSSQCGVSEWLLNIAFWLATCHRYNSTLVEPADPELRDFIHGRVDPAIQDCAYLTSQVSDTNNVGLKKVGKAFVYFRGSRKPHKLKTIDSDCMLYDELDELTAGTRARGEKRLGHSLLKWQRAVSTPTYPEDGIDELYNDSDQMQWFIKCEHCGLQQTLTFFDNVDVEQCVVICKKCKKPINRLQQGEWIAAYPKRKLRGYHINKLFCERTNLVSLVENSKKIAQFEVQEFYNQDLGLAFAPKGNRLSKVAIRACKSDDYTVPYLGTHCTMGVDVGTVLNVRISTYEAGKRRAVFIKHVNEFEELYSLMDNYDVDVCVIDANPETRKAKEFQEKFVGRVYLAYYWPSDDKRTDLLEVQEDEESGVDVVKINRTQAGDYVVGEFQHRKVELPANAEEIQGYFAQLMAPLRIVKKDARGNEVAVYEEFGKPDHYFHSEIYDYIAKKIADGDITTFVRNSVQGTDRAIAFSGTDRDTAEMDW